MDDTNTHNRTRANIIKYARNIFWLYRDGSSQVIHCPVSLPEHQGGLIRYCEKVDFLNFDVDSSPGIDRSILKAQQNYFCHHNYYDRIDIFRPTISSILEPMTSEQLKQTTAILIIAPDLQDPCLKEYCRITRKHHFMVLTCTGPVTFLDGTILSHPSAEHKL